MTLRNFSRQPKANSGFRKRSSFRTPFKRVRKKSNINIARFINKVKPLEPNEQFVSEHSFNDFAIEQILKDNISLRGYLSPTPIQDKVIPHVLKGADVVGVANTGTGKTGAFLIPLFQKILKNPKEKVLIVVPTRELAIQIDDELRSLALRMQTYSVCCVGGANIGQQIAKLRRNHNFVIGTPGRLKDLIQRKVIRLEEFNSVVLDEVDRMFDMGFIRDVKFLMLGLPKMRHSLFFSATISKEIYKMIDEFLRNPVIISVKTRETAENVDQDVIKTGGKAKIEVLHDMLIKPEFSKVLIFGRTKQGVERLSRDLSDRGFKARSIHGNKNQSQRQNALNLFRNNQLQILVATDVVARGLDISNITHVINYEIPESYDDYIHRIGRTGRANKKGIALTFV
ncbi:MAG: RNA helicase [Candidatus Yanofskybacteria bacterium CG10_big_fil_rev_8_21_14_0_10_36_16]|uniref:RNA helicase n=1 Tax=Candidatus Yanofskybacteria bacterium CG10_big_fil_rev_8_21_14_0_10_36_16 TaxID=1975096 RepID=A0A2J0Q7C8_9BACT|nr:MAG: RNA helicase [Candidatus Yanofskybacteria bacterium CG10_big_fil_rev_8_21_14_0_10_36_16]